MPKIKVLIAALFLFSTFLFLSTGNASAVKYSFWDIWQTPRTPKIQKIKVTPTPTILPTPIPQISLSVTPTRKPSVSSQPTVTPTPTKGILPSATPTVSVTSAPKSTSSPTPTPTPSQTHSSVSLSTEQQFIMDAINAYRATQGLGSVSPDANTCNFATTRAQEITSSFTHDGFNNRINSHTLPYSSYHSITENIAMTSNYQDVVTMWINSPGHAANMRADTPYVCVAKSGDYYAYEGWKP